MADAPLWSVDDIVYLRESAVIGFIESYKVTGIRFDQQWNRWIYEIAIKHRGTEPSSVIDMYNLRHKEVLSLGENDLIDLASALDLAIVNTEQRLTELINKNGSFKTVLLSTSAIHMKRSLLCFNKQGLDVIPFSVDRAESRKFYPDELLLPRATILSDWYHLIHEWVGVLTYKIVGYC